MTTGNQGTPEEGTLDSDITNATEPTETAPERQFTQAEVNKITSDIRREVTRKSSEKFSDYDDLKARAAKADELESAQLSEAERLTARLQEAEKRAIAASDQASAAMIASEVKVRAVEMGIIDPDAAFVLMDRTNVQYSAENGVSGVEDSLTSLLESKPWLRSTNRTPNINPEGTQSTPVVRLTPEQREAARYLKMTEEDYAAHVR